MAKDKAVDSTQLNTDLTSVANAIRSKGGTQAQLAFPAGFVSAIQAIPTGGGGLDFSNTTNLSYLFRSRPELLDGADTIDWSSVTEADYAFQNAVTTAAADATFQNKVSGVRKTGISMFAGCSELTDVDYDENNITYNGGTNIFDGCVKMHLADAVAMVVKAISNGNINADLSSAFSNCGTSYFEYPDIEGFSIKATTFKSMFSNCKLKSIGPITVTNNAAMILGYMFPTTHCLESVGKISVYTLNTTSSNQQNIINISGASALKKFGGIEIRNPSGQNNIPLSSTAYLLSGVGTVVEEILDMPISFFGYGAKNIMSMAGTANSPRPLKRLTFNTTNIAYKNKTNAKSFSIAYCSFDRDGMVEMFNSLPDASDVTGAKVITITGNPCVLDGTLTAADRAIATNKGYSLTE